mmetsp:Transcript_90288/g.292192  ORF Transcript_90288/g.292192 Transcript_90288/m.292192 type:complete len:325 (-) Transcript_90288:1531-2505(-)
MVEHPRGRPRELLGERSPRGAGEQRLTERCVFGARHRRPERRDLQGAIQREARDRPGQLRRPVRARGLQQHAAARLRGVVPQRQRDRPGGRAFPRGVRRGAGGPGGPEHRGQSLHAESPCLCLHIQRSPVPSQPHPHRVHRGRAEAVALAGARVVAGGQAGGARGLRGAAWRGRADVGLCRHGPDPAQDGGHADRHRPGQLHAGVAEDRRAGRHRDGGAAVAVRQQHGHRRERGQLPPAPAAPGHTDHAERVHAALAQQAGEDADEPVAEVHTPVDGVSHQQHGDLQGGRGAAPRGQRADGAAVLHGLGARGPALLRPGLHGWP